MKKMLYPETFYNKIINKALQIVSATETIEEINKKKGEVLKEKKGKKKSENPEYYLTYKWQNDEQYQEWLKFVEKEVRKFGKTKEDKIQSEVDWLDASLSLSHNYLFNPKPTLF